MSNITESLKIKYLADVPELIHTIANWAIEAWGKYDPTLTMERELKSLNQKLNRDKVPLVLVAFKNDEPIATVNLKTEIPFAGYEDRDLWLGSFIVREQYQGMGVGSYLLEQVYAKAKSLGYKKISLFSSSAERAEWYSKHGWTKFASDVYQNHNVTLLERNI